MDPTPAIRFESDPPLLKLATKGSIIQRQNLTQFVHVYMVKQWQRKESEKSIN